MLNRLLRLASVPLPSTKGGAGTDRLLRGRRWSSGPPPPGLPGPALLASGPQPQGSFCCLAGTGGAVEGLGRVGLGFQTLKGREQVRVAAGGGRGDQNRQRGPEGGRVRAPRGDPGVRDVLAVMGTRPLPGGTHTHKFPGAPRPEGGPHGGKPHARRHKPRAGEEDLP